MPRPAALLTLLAIGGMLTTAAVNDFVDRRVVDAVRVGDFESELHRGFADHESNAASDSLGSYRVVSGWLHYSLATFEDTEVTVGIALTSEREPRLVDVLVEDSLIRTVNTDSLNQPGIRVASAAGAGITMLEIDVPFTLTRGKSQITVVLRSRNGVTPKLREVRTIQYHNEFLQ